MYSIYDKIMHDYDEYALEHAIGISNRDLLHSPKVYGLQSGALDEDDWDRFEKAAKWWAAFWTDESTDLLSEEHLQRAFVPGLHLLMGARQTGKSYVLSQIDEINAESTRVHTIGEPSAKIDFVGDIDAFIKKIVDTTYGTANDESKSITEPFSVREDPDDDESKMKDSDGYKYWIEKLNLSDSVWPNGKQIPSHAPQVVTLDSISSVLSSPNVTKGGYYPGGLPTCLEDYMTYLNNAFARWNIVAIATFNPHDFKGEVPDFPGSIASTYLLSGTVDIDESMSGDDARMLIRKQSKIWSYRYPRAVKLGKAIETRYFGKDDMAANFFGSKQVSNANRPVSTTSIPTVSEKIAELNGVIRNNL